MKYVYQDDDGTKLTVRSSSTRIVFTMNDGWHDVIVALPQAERDKLLGMLRWLPVARGTA